MLTFARIKVMARTVEFYFVKVTNGYMKKGRAENLPLK